MTDTARPEVLIIGDSHAAALKAGCDALGIASGILSASGNFWHMGRVVFDPVQGIRMRGNRALAAQARQISDRLGGGPVLRRDLPVIVTAGYNLGRLVPRLGAGRHVTSAEAFDSDPEAQFLSDAVLRAYIAHHREPQLRVVRRLARCAPVTVVPPPVRQRAALWRASLATVTGMMRAARLNLYDPMPDLAGPDGWLDDSYFAADLRHGNARYGQAVVEHLRARGALGHNAAAPAA